jgi:hypothetical protein
VWPTGDVTIASKAEIPVGTYEVVEADAAKLGSDHRGDPVEGVASAQFRYRYRPGPLGEFFDEASPTYKQNVRLQYTKEDEPRAADSRFPGKLYDSRSLLQGTVTFKHTGGGWKVDTIKFN